MTTDILLQLIRFGLGNGDSFTLPGSVDWDGVIQRAMSYGLDAIAFDGLQAVYDHSFCDIRILLCTCTR